MVASSAGGSFTGMTFAQYFNTSMRIGYRLSKELFPYQPHWLDHRGIRVHYVDEGNGRPILFLHGNPTSSFLYRGLIERLRSSFRCVAVDYPGFGLSDRPESGYGYTPREHAEVVDALVTKLDLSDLIVMGQDWGGPIGLATALEHRDRTSGLVFANTWYWPAEGPALNGFSLVMGSPPMQWLILKRNFFVERLVPAGVARPLAPEVMEVYRALQPTPEARRGVAEFPKEIRRSGEWLRRLAERAPRELGDRPMLLFWGHRDRAFGGQRAVRDRWMRDFPSAEVVDLPEASHYIQEDSPEELAEHIQRKFGTAASSGRPDN
jgi:haloalkane dehalogenase